MNKKELKNMNFTFNFILVIMWIVVGVSIIVDVIETRNIDLYIIFIIPMIVSIIYRLLEEFIWLLIF